MLLIYNKKNEFYFYNFIFIKMNTDICSLIASFIIKEKYELLDWINKTHLHIDILSLNKFSIDYLEKKK